jgi:hypothetical protein
MKDLTAFAAADIVDSFMKLIHHILKPSFELQHPLIHHIVYLPLLHAPAAAAAADASVIDTLPLPVRIICSHSLDTPCIGPFS